MTAIVAVAPATVPAGVLQVAPVSDQLAGTDSVTL